MSNSLGTLTLDLIAKIGGFTAPLTEAERKAKSSMKGISNAAKDGSKSIETMGKVADVAKLAIVGVVTAAATLGATKLIEVQRQFDVLNAGLVTATGSTQGAAEAFGILQQFAATTPYSLNQAVEGFNKLVNLGLTPSEAALKAYGNTAAAMGKDLNQMIEAVADAATGEFERLKEFGIKAKQNGDTVAFTFQGVTTKIGNNAAEIEKYLIKIGEVNFAGAMDRRAKTLDGALSNLGDTFDNLFLTISQSGFGEILAEGVGVATNSIQGLIDSLKSGEIRAELGGLATAFSIFGDDAKGDIQGIMSATSDMRKALGIDSDAMIERLNTLGNAWQDFRAIVQTAATLAAASVEKFRTGEDQSANIQQSLEGIKAVADSRRDAVKSGFDLAKNIKEGDDILNEIAKEAKAKDASDKLVKFGLNKGKGSTSQSSSDAKKAEDELKKAQSQFKSLQDLASTETEKANKSLDERLKLIGRFATKGSAEYTKLTDWAIKENKRQLDEEIADNKGRENQFNDQLSMLSDFSRSAQEILNEKLVSDKANLETSFIGEKDAELKRNQLRLALEKQYNHDSAEILIKREQERTAILQGLQDKRDATSFGETNAITGALGGSTQAGINQNVFSIQQQVMRDVEAEQNKMRDDMAAADRQAANEKIALIRQVGDAEIQDAQRTSAAVLDTRAALLSAGTAIEDGIAQSLTKAIIAGDSLSESLRSAALSGVETLLQSMIKIGIQTLVNAAMGTAATAAQVAASSAAAIELALVWAPAEAAVSLATGGSNAIGAASGIVSTHALSTALALGFADGGYTGAGGKNDPAGIVHKGEVVWSQDDIRRAGGVNNVEAMRLGMRSMMQNDKGMNAMRQNSQMQQMQPSSNNVSMSNKIINLIDPDLLGDYLKTNAGERVLVNTISRARSQVNQVLQ